MGAMLVTNPDGESVRRDIKITFDEDHGGSFQVEVIGESPLKGYAFLVRQADLKRVRDTGTPE
jgi:hypothetical protein